MLAGMTRSGVISDALWEVISTVKPPPVGRRGRPLNDHLATLEAIAWRFRTGSPWRDIPAEFGAWQSIWERHHRWSIDGTYAAMLAAVHASGRATEAARAGLISIDSTIVRAHQHAAGAATHTGGRVESQESGG
jgi:putative transposase